MRGFVAFCRKDLLEQVRTFRLPVVLIAFLLVGLGSPLLAKFTPELLGSMSGDEMRGMELIVVHEPDATDALIQYRKNFFLLPLLVVLLNFGAISGERGRGVTSMALVKPVSRTAYLLAKAAVPAALLTVATALAGAGAWLYTTVLFGEIDALGFAVVNGLLLLSLLAYLALTIFGSAITDSQAVSAGIGLGGFVAFAILGALPAIARYAPPGLATAVMDITLGREPIAPGVTVTASLAFIAALLAAGALILRRQELS